jgi:bacterioferritin-associated ferredoxin
MTVRDKVIEALRAGPATMRELAERLGVCRQSVSAALTVLQAIERVRAVNDLIKRKRQYEIAPDYRPPAVPVQATGSPLQPAANAAGPCYHRGLCGWGRWGNWA